MIVFSNRIKSFTAIVAFLLLGIFNTSFADQEAHEESAEEPLNISDIILHHVVDDHVWHLWDGHYGTIFLPVIVYSSEKGLEMFSSHNFYDEHHNLVEYNGYKLEHNHITLTDSGKAAFDISITKNVAMLFINAILLVLVMRAVAKGYLNNKGKAPKGIQSFFEPIIIFVRDEIVKPNISHHPENYLPYILTLFFFILFGNILGLLPGAANLTGNIAVTLTLAVLTFIITNVKGNKEYWKHVFWTPGVPLIMRLIIMPVEVVGLFTKPFALTVRLFVAITAGHIVLLSLICMAFIFQSVTVGFVSSLIVLFINLIEILVAGIQAYVFALFTALYIGMSTAKHDEHH